MSTILSTEEIFGITRDHKRKLDFASDDIIWQDFPPAKKKKKKKKKKSKKNKDPNQTGDNSGSGQNLYLTQQESNSTSGEDSCPNNNVTIMNNLSNFAMVSAKPDNLASTPQIFNKEDNKNQDKLPQMQDTSNLFYLNCISEKSFSSDIRSRFINFIKACEPNIDKQTSLSKDSRKKNKTKSHKIDPALQKLRQEHAEIARRENTLKLEKKIEDLLEESWNSVQEEVRHRDNQEREEALNNEQDPGDDVYSRNKDIEMVPQDGSYKVDIYETCLKEAVLFHMYHPSEFSFHGEIKITVIAGEIEILGCTVSESTLKSVDVYSPNFYTPLIIECNELKKSYDEEDIRKKIEHLLNKNETNKLLNNFQYFNGAILLVEQIKSTFGRVIDLYFHKSLFSKDLVDFSSNSESLKSLQSTFNFKRKNDGIRRNLQWDGIPMGHCVVVCGGHGVGKSTLLKYFVNKALTHNKKVLCLDFDPGQPEFTPSGFVSAVIVDKPLLGPNFSHMIDPEIMAYFGSVDVAYNPTMYLECVNYVIEKCREKEELSHMTWFVNTMGFNRGVGVELMTVIIKLLKPNVVVQIRSPDVKRNYPCYFTPRHVNGKRNVWSVLKRRDELSYDLRVVDSFAQKGSRQGGLTAKHLRDILFFSYFSKIVSPPDYSLNAVKPYLRSFSNLYLGIESSICPSEILKAFNGSLVSLLHFEHGSEEIFVTEAEADEYFKIVLKPAVSSSFGLGLIRGINVEEKTFYILTHLSIEKLDRVNCLSLGRIHTPHSTFLTQEDVKGQLPYTCVSTIDSIQKVNRFFPQPSGTPANPHLEV